MRADAGAAGDGDLEARAANSLAIRRARADDLAGAIELGTQAADRASSADDPFLAGQVLYNLAAVYDRAGRTEEALDAFARAAELGRATGAAAFELAVQVNLGAMLNRRHRYQAALDLFEQVIARAGELDLPPYVATARINEGAALAQLGEPERARASYLEALNGLDPDDVRDRVIVELDLGDLAFAGHDDEEARRRFESVVDRARGTAGLADLERAAQGYLGSLDVRAGRVAEGRERLESVARAFRDTGEELLLQQVLGELAEARRRAGDLAGAGNAAEEAAALARRTGDLESEAEAHGATRACCAKGDVAAALAEVGTAVATIETIRGALPAAELRASYLARFRFLYDLGVELSLDLDRREPAPDTRPGLSSGRSVRARAVCSSRCRRLPGPATQRRASCAGAAPT